MSKEKTSPIVINDYYVEGAAGEPKFLSLQKCEVVSLITKDCLVWSDTDELTDEIEKSMEDFSDVLDKEIKRLTRLKNAVDGILYLSYFIQDQLET